MKSENHQTHRDRTVISIISGFCSMANTYLRTVVTIARIMYLLLSSILFVGVSSASDGKTEPSDDHLLVEHSVSLESAKNAIQHLAPDLSIYRLFFDFLFQIIPDVFVFKRYCVAPVIGAGCKVCTQREIEYCLSVAVIDDHCCCQRKYHGTNSKKDRYSLPSATGRVIIVI